MAGNTARRMGQGLLMTAMMVLPAMAVGASAEPDVLPGDLFVGSHQRLEFGVPVVGKVVRIRDGVATQYCTSPNSPPGYFTAPQDVAVTSDGTVYFLASAALWRCASKGAAPEVLMPSAELFPGHVVDRTMGLRVAWAPRVTLDASGVSAGFEEVLDWNAAVVDPVRNVRVGLETVRYHPTTDRGETSLQPVQVGATSRHGIMPDSWASGLTTYSVNSNVIRRTAEGVSLDATIGEFILRVRAFTGGREVVGANVDDRNKPNPQSGCQSTLYRTDMPLDEGMFKVLDGLSQVVVDPGFGLVLMSTSGSAGTPYLTATSEVLLNDDADDDRQATFTNPNLACLPFRMVEHTSILPWWDTSVAPNIGNTVTRLASGPGGMFGTQQFDNRVVQVKAGTRAVPVATGLVEPIGIAVAPDGAQPPSHDALVAEAHGCAELGMTGPDGRRLGRVLPGEPEANDLGVQGYQSGPGSVRLYAVLDPAPGAWEVIASGAGCAAYRVRLHAVDFVNGAVDSYEVRNSVPPGGTRVHRFALSPDSTILSGDGTPPVTLPQVLGGIEGRQGWWRSDLDVQLDAADDDSGVAATLAGLDGAPMMPSGALRITRDGVHEATYASVDLAGNAEPPASATYRIDATPPATSEMLGGTSGESGWWRSGMTVNLACADATSGCWGTQAALDDQAPFAYVSPFAVTGDGLHQVARWSEDIAGNSEASPALEVRIDTTPPEVLLAEPTAGSVYADGTRLPEDALAACPEVLAEVCGAVSAGDLRGTVLIGANTIVAEASDLTSGVVRVELRLDGVLRASDGAAPYELPLDVSADALGEHVLEVRAVDAAGNMASEARTVTTVPTTVVGVAASMPL